MQASAFFSAHRAFDDEGGGLDQISQFQKLAGDAEVPVELLNLALEIPKSGSSALESLVRADDGNVVQHESADLIPVMIDDHQFIEVLRITPFPHWNLVSLSRRFAERELGQDHGNGTLGDDEALEQGIARKTVGAMQAGAPDLAHGRQTPD